jgi:hypothetical protein
MNDEIQIVGSNDSPVRKVEEGIVLSPTSPTNALIEALSGGKSHKYARFVMAALGSVPWVGALASLSAEFDQEKLNDLLKLYVQEQQPKFEELKTTLGEIVSRLEGLDEGIQQRVESPEYLSLVRIAFRSWDDAETAEKREYIKRLISNAGATKLCPDDLVRLFIGWINTYHESHFAVIKEIYKSPGITRGKMWDNVHTERPREDSAEADLFRYLVRDLSIGGVIRQEKATNRGGQFMKSRPTRTTKGFASQVMESAFEDTKPYILTELGNQFIHYVLSDVVRRVESSNSHPAGDYTTSNVIVL